MRSMRTLATAVASTGWLFAAGLILAPRADGATVTKEQHCVVRVTSHDADGRLRTTEPTCAATRTDALRQAGVSLSPAAADHPIGIHYDGYGYTGSSLTVVGADCTGGWLNTPAGWSNRISSTMHGCPRIRHFDGYNLVSPEQTTLAPGANLLAMNNRTSSIQYLP